LPTGKHGLGIEKVIQLQYANYINNTNTFNTSSNFDSPLPRELNTELAPITYKQITQI